MKRKTAGATQFERRRACSVALEEAAPLGPQHLTNPTLANQVVPVAIVVEPRGDEAQGCQRAAQEQLLKRFERAPVDQLLAAAGEGVLVILEAKVDAGDVVTDQLNLPDVAAAEAGF